MGRKASDGAPFAFACACACACGFEIELELEVEGALGSARAAPVDGVDDEDDGLVAECELGWELELELELVAGLLLYASRS